MQSIWPQFAYRSDLITDIIELADGKYIESIEALAVYRQSCTCGVHLYPNVLYIIDLS